MATVEMGLGVFPTEPPRRIVDRAQAWGTADLGGELRAFLGNREANAMAWKMTCKQCGADLGSHENIAASITLEVMGDEHSYTYWLCEACGLYTVVVGIDPFFGEKE